MAFNFSMLGGESDEPHGRKPSSGGGFNFDGLSRNGAADDRPLEDVMREHGSLSEPEDKRSGFARVVDALFSAPEFVTRETWRMEQDMLKLAAEGHPLAKPAAQIAGFVKGTVDTFATPGDALLTATGLRAVRDASRPISLTARALEGAGLGGLTARGVERVVDSDSGGETAAGALQALLGVAGLSGLRQPRTPAQQPIRGRLQLTGQVQPDFVSAPGGVVGRPGDIPLSQAPDGSFVRAEPAEYARREIRALLDDPRGFVTDADGNIVPRTQAERLAATVSDVDPNLGAAERAHIEVTRGEWPQKEVRGLLPAGPRFVADEAGNIAPLDDVNKLAPQQRIAREPQARGPRAEDASVDVVPARVVDREFDGARVTRKIFGSDPSLKADAPKVQMTPQETLAMRRVLAELENTEFTKHSFIDPGVGRGGAPEIVPGGGGAPIFQDITSGANVTRAQVEDSIRNMLEGKHSAWGQRALDFVRAEARGDRRGQHILPPDAGIKEPSFVPGRMGDEDFSEFSRYVDEQATLGPDTLPGERDPGQEGFINAQLAQHLGGAVMGGTAGAATGDDTESRVKGALIGAFLGGGAPSLIGRQPARQQGLATLAEQLKAKGITPDSLDPRLSGAMPTQRPSGPEFTDPIQASYERVLKQGGRMLDRVKRDQQMRGILVNQAGAANPALLAHVGGGVVGGTIGAATGDDLESRVRNGLIGVGLGVAGPSLVMRGRLRALGGPAGTASNAGAAGTVTGRLRMTSDIPTTGRPAGRPKHGMADPLRGVDVFVEKFPDEMRGGIADVIHRNGGFEAQRRGSMPQEDIARLADGVIVDLSRRVKPGTALNAEAVSAHVNALAGVQSKVQDLTARIARGQNTDADVLALEAARAELSTLAASVMGARSEAGRSLAQWRMLARVLDTGNPQLMAEAAAGLRGDAAQFAADFAKQPNDSLQRFRWLQSQNQPGRMERLRQYYLTNILSGVKTHERNAIGNLANAVSHLAVHPVAAGVDALRSAVTGQQRTVFLSEMPSQTVGALYGLQEGMREALFSARYGVNRSALTQSLSAAEAGKLDVPRIEFKGGGANPFNYPGRALDAADQFFRAIARNMERGGLAHAQAKRERLTGEAFNQRMAELLAGAGDEGQRILESADTFARRSVFQEKAGPLVGHMQALAQKYPALSFVMPFIRTPANILRQGAEFSPAGFAMKAARQGGRAGAQAQARATIGTVAAGGLAYLAATGQLSGSGPSDPIERAQLMESGWRPNSVRIGDKWVQIALFQPVSVPAMAIANAFESWRDSGMKEAGAATKAFEAARGFGRSVLDLSFLSGVADLFAAMSNSGPMSAKGAEYAGRLASGFVPFSGAQRTLTHAIDPVVRKPDGFTEQVMTGIPGLSDNVPARINRFGQDVTRQGGPLKRAADPFDVSTVSNDPVLAELGRLNVRMGMPAGKMGGVELDRAQQLQLQKLKGSAAHELLSKVVSSPKYARLSDERKAELLEAAIDRARGAVQKGARKQLRGRLIQQRGR